MLRNILGPVFNLYLDQFLTYKICYFFFFFWGGGAETPIFIVFSAKNAKFKETQKKKKTLFVNTIVLTALVKMSVFFSAFFIFAVFSISIFQRCFWLVSQNQKIQKKQSKQNKKQEQKEDKRCKAKTNEILWFKTKQDNKQNNRNQRTT